MRWLIAAAVAVALFAPRLAAAMMVKPDADLRDIRPEMVPVWNAVSAAWVSRGLTPTLTEYRRDDPGSLHAVGLAMDFRTFDIAPAVREELALEVSQRTGPAYQVILEDGIERRYFRAGDLEGAGHARSVPAHMHVEKDR